MYKSSYSFLEDAHAKNEPKLTEKDEKTASLRPNYTDEISRTPTQQCETSAQYHTRFSLCSQSSSSSDKQDSYCKLQDPNCPFCKKTAQPLCLIGQCFNSDSNMFTPKKIKNSVCQSKPLSQATNRVNYKIEPGIGSKTMNESYFYCKTANFCRFEEARAEVVCQSKKNLEKIQHTIIQKVSNTDSKKDESEGKCNKPLSIETKHNPMQKCPGLPTQLRQSNSCPTLSSFSLIKHLIMMLSPNSSEDSVTTASTNNNASSERIENDFGPELFHMQNKKEPKLQKRKDTKSTSSRSKFRQKSDISVQNNQQPLKKIVIKNLTTFPETQQYQVEKLIQSTKHQGKTTLNESEICTKRHNSKTSVKTFSSASFRRIPAQTLQSQHEKAPPHFCYTKSKSPSVCLIQSEEKQSFHKTLDLNPTPTDNQDNTITNTSKCINNPADISKETSTSGFQENLLETNNACKHYLEIRNESHSIGVQTEPKLTAKMKKLNNTQITKRAKSEAVNFGRKNINHRKKETYSKTAKIIQTNCPHIPREECNRNPNVKKQTKPKRKGVQVNVISSAFSQKAISRSFGTNRGKSNHPFAHPKTKSDTQRIREAQKDSMLSKKLDNIYELAENLIICLSSI